MLVSISLCSRRHQPRRMSPALIRYHVAITIPGLVSNGSLQPWQAWLSLSTAHLLNCPFPVWVYRGFRRSDPDPAQHLVRWTALPCGCVAFSVTGSQVTWVSTSPHSASAAMLTPSSHRHRASVHIFHFCIKIVDLVVWCPDYTNSFMFLSSSALCFCWGSSFIFCCCCCCFYVLLSCYLVGGFCLQVKLFCEVF